MFYAPGGDVLSALLACLFTSFLRLRLLCLFPWLPPKKGLQNCYRAVWLCEKGGQRVGKVRGPLSVDPVARIEHFDRVGREEPGQDGLLVLGDIAGTGAADKERRAVIAGALGDLRKVHDVIHGGVDDAQVDPKANGVVGRCAVLDIRHQELPDGQILEGNFNGK